MVKNVIYLEGSPSGPDSKNLQRKCKEAFRKLFENCGFVDSMPRLFASGSRDNAFRDFTNSIQQHTGYVAMLIDSEGPIADAEKPWDHLKKRDKSWKKPKSAIDEQVLLMTTCQETWVLADLQAKRGDKVDVNLEEVVKEEIKARLDKVSDSKYDKSSGIQFEFVGAIDPDNLMPLPSFARMIRILKKFLTAV